MHHSRVVILQVVVAAAAVALIAHSVAAVITIQVGGATRLGSSSISRSRERYSCYWDCDLIRCEITRDDDECEYKCDKLCRPQYDFAAGRSGVETADLQPKSTSQVGDAKLATNDQSVADELARLGAGTSVKLHLPRNVSARNFGILERCSSDSVDANEKPFN